MSNLNHPHDHVIVQRTRPAWLLLALATLLLLACELPSLIGAPTSTTPQPSPTLVSNVVPLPTPKPANPTAPTLVSNVAPLSTPKPTNPPAPTRAPVLADDPRAALLYTMRAQIKAMPFSVLSETTSGATKIKTFVEFESPKRVRVTSATGIVVLYDGKFFVKEGNAAWREDSRAAAAITGALGMLDPAGIETFIGMLKTVKQIGSETLDGIPCRVYEYTYAGDQFGVQSSGKAQLWVAEDSGLSIKQVTDSETAGYKATATKSFDYKPSNKIESPIIK